MVPRSSPELAWLSEFILSCRSGGIDLARSFGLATFHAQAAPEHHLVTFDRPNPLALVLANTRALWPAFVQAFRARPDLAERAHPLDDYVEEVIGDALRMVSIRHRAYWAHHRTDPVVPMQRLAAAAGLAELGPAHLSVHPTYGPWIGLRAVLVFDVDAETAAAEPTAPFSHCENCAAPCKAALQKALSESQEHEAPSDFPPPPHLNARHRAWVAVRDACPVGREARYTPLQIYYHYTKDRRGLDCSREHS